ncbi:MAG TPA: hypothetical protein VKB84_00320 [Candidatus Binataceae bacterium]|nr:hypothetical protein [Candidatus Binataceae bacterium]
MEGEAIHDGRIQIINPRAIDRLYCQLGRKDDVWLEPEAKGQLQTVGNPLHGVAFVDETRMPAAQLFGRELHDLARDRRAEERARSLTSFRMTSSRVWLSVMTREFSLGRLAIGQYSPRHD